MPKQLVRNQDLASDTARQNLLVNPGLEVWQRGNGPYTSLSPTVMSADRWKTYAEGTGAPTISVIPDASNYDGAGSRYCAAVTATTNATGSLVGINQDIEEVYQLRGRTVTFAARVRCSVAGICAVRVYWNSGGNNTVTPTTYNFHTGDNTYQTLSITSVVGANATFFRVEVFVQGASINTTFWVDNCTLVVGQVPMTYIPMNLADDVARCLRYYERALSSDGNSELIFSGQAQAAGATIRNLVWLKAKKAATPTLTAIGTWVAANVTASSFTLPVAGVNVFWVYYTATNAGDSYYYASGGGANITIEANP